MKSKEDERADRGACVGRDERELCERQQSRSTILSRQTQRGRGASVSEEEMIKLLSPLRLPMGSQPDGSTATSDAAVMKKE